MWNHVFAITIIMPHSMREEDHEAASQDSHEALLEYDHTSPKDNGKRFWDERTFWHEIAYKSLIPTFGKPTE